MKFFFDLLISFSKNKLLNEFWQLSHSDIFLPKPIYISIFLGEGCPLNCQHCSFWKVKNPRSLNFDQGEKIISYLKSWLGTFRLNFTGGEPLANKDFLKIVKFAESNGVICGAASNGFLIDEKKASKIIDSGLSNINISLDALDQKTHDFIRGRKGAFQKAIQAIKFLKAKRKKKPLIYLNTLICKKNLDHLAKIVLWAKMEDLDGVNFQPIISDHYFGAKKDLADWYKRNPLWPDDFERVSQVLDELFTLKKQRYPINNLEKKEIGLLKSYFQNPEKKIKNTCLIATRNFYISPEGEVQICQSLSSIGNIYRQNPQDIWRSKKAQKQRELIRRCRKSCQLLLCNRPHFYKRLATSFLRFLRQNY